MQGIVAAAIGAAALLLTSGCAAQPAAPEPSVSAEPTAASGAGLVHGTVLTEAEERLRITVFMMGTEEPDIGAVARDLVDANELRLGSIELIGVEEGAAASDGDDFGAVLLRVLPRSAGASAWHTPEPDPPVCFRVTWNRYYDTGSTQIACDPDAQRIEPPVNTATVFVIPVDAGDVAQAVLRELPASPPAAAEIAAMIDARVTAPTGELERAYPADVALDGDDVGVAFGLHTECQMYLRVGGEVGLGSVRWTSLQEGEGGCTAWTALHPPL